MIVSQKVTAISKMLVTRYKKIIFRGGVWPGNEASKIATIMHSGYKITGSFTILEWL